jgi:hypothetical protein
MLKTAIAFRLRGSEDPNNHIFCTQWDGELTGNVYTRNMLPDHFVPSAAYCSVFPRTYKDLWGFVPIEIGDYIEWFEGYPVEVHKQAFFKKIYEEVSHA